MPPTRGADGGKRVLWSRPLDGERFERVLQAWLGGEPLAHAPAAAAAAPPCGALYSPASLRRLRRLGAGAFARVELCEACEAGGGRVRVAAKALLPEARAHAAARRALAYGTYVRSRGVVLVLVLVHAAPSATGGCAERAGRVHVCARHCTAGCGADRQTAGLAAWLSALARRCSRSSLGRTCARAGTRLNTPLSCIGDGNMAEGSLCLLPCSL